MLHRVAGRQSQEPAGRELTDWQAALVCVVALILWVALGVGLPIALFYLHVPSWLSVQ